MAGEAAFKKVRKYQNKDEKESGQGENSADGLNFLAIQFLNDKKGFSTTQNG
jgi:hypothetical protein